MIFALKFKEADVTINWLAASLTPESSPYVDALPIDEKYAQKKKLVLSILRYTTNLTMAQRFLDYASSPEGLSVFSSKGLGE
jgi:molybdate transport system substrate-binding protein